MVIMAGSTLRLSPHPRVSPVVEALVVETPEEEEARNGAPHDIFLGSLQQGPSSPFRVDGSINNHNVQGDVYIINDKVLEIRNFVYDGRGEFMR